ncbi:MAG: hypothetical protein U0263_09580 [Polyangiaceae bacterium]
MRVSTRAAAGPVRSATSGRSAAAARPGSPSAANQFELFAQVRVVPEQERAPREPGRGVELRSTRHERACQGNARLAFPLGVLALGSGPDSRCVVGELRARSVRRDTGALRRSGART